MTWDQVIAQFSVAISFVGLLLVILQLRGNAKAQASQSLVEIYDINRQLISLGFEHPQLFDILADANNADPVWERRYLQLWLNQMSLIHSYLKRSVFESELEQSLERDITDFMRMRNMRKHWYAYRSFYPLSFQELVNDLIWKGRLSDDDASSGS